MVFPLGWWMVADAERREELRRERKQKEGLKKHEKQREGEED